MTILANAIYFWPNQIYNTCTLFFFAVGSKVEIKTLVRSTKFFMIEHKKVGRVGKNLSLVMSSKEIAQIIYQHNKLHMITQFWFVQNNFKLNQTESKLFTKF